MKKIVLFAVSCLLITSLFAQDSIPARKKTTVTVSSRSGDHFMVQGGYTGWSGQPDSINTRNFSKSFNVYLMFDFPFKSNPKLSMAIGPGISTDHIMFQKTYVDLTGQTAHLQFVNQEATDHFKKTKLATAYFEAPVELRYRSNPESDGKSWKFAVGVKVGTIIDAHTRNKNLENAAGNTINEYKMKESSRKYFNSTRFAGIARFGYGHITIYGSYQFNPMFKPGVAAEIRPYSIGLSLSGL